jgi:hypothetical protein
VLFRNFFERCVDGPGFHGTMLTFRR